MPNKNPYFIPKENLPKVAEVRYMGEDQKFLTQKN